MLTELHLEGRGTAGSTSSTGMGGGVILRVRLVGKILVWLQAGKGSPWAGEAAGVGGQVEKGSSCPPKEVGLTLMLISSTRLLRSCVLAKSPCCSMDARLKKKKWIR